MFYCVTFLKTSSSSQVQHIHNIHHLLFQCQNKPQWCFHSPHLNTFTNLSPYNVEVQWHVSSASPSIQCQTQLVIIDHLGFHCVACFKSFSIHPGQMCPRLLEKKKKKERKKERKKSLFKGCSVQLSCSFISTSLLSHEPQQARPPCSSPTPMGLGVKPSSYLILWGPLFLLPSIFPSVRMFSTESTLHIG